MRLFAWVFIVVAFPLSTSAATLFFAPTSNTVQVGGTLSVDVNVSSPDRAMNAVSAEISYPSNVELLAVSKAGSILTIWAAEPSFSNAKGVATFEGIVPNPGYTGGSGRLVTLTFRAKAAGNATLSFLSGSVLANDGLATNILTASPGARISISEGTPAPAPAPKLESKTPASRSDVRLVVVSPTHPDETKAYRAPRVRFEWGVPPGVEAVRILYDDSPRTTPTVFYSPPISFKEITAEDGVWYFHAQARTADGWGPVTHFKFTIDPNEPEHSATSTPAPLFDVHIEPTPQKSDEGLVERSLRLLNYAGLAVLLVGVLVAGVIGCIYLWNRMRQSHSVPIRPVVQDNYQIVIPTVVDERDRLAEGDRQLYTDVRELQRSIRVEIVRLKAVSNERSLTPEEAHTLNLLEATNAAMTREFLRS